MASTRKGERVFKTSWFTRAAKKAGISDEDLCKAVRQAMAGQCDDLGGGVFKKRIAQNLYRSIILAKGGRHWILQYLFAKKDRENIDDAELKWFRQLAKDYEKVSGPQLARLLKDKELTEICHDDQA